MRKAWGTLLHWGFLQWRPRQGSDILSRHHTALWTLGFWFKCYPDSPKPLSPSLLQASVLPSITGNGIVLYIRDDAVIRGLILWNMPVREWLFHWCFCLSWIFFLLISEVSYRKKKYHRKPWGWFHPRDLQINLPGWNVNDYSMNKPLFTSKNHFISDPSQVKSLLLFFFFNFFLL